MQNLKVPFFTILFIFLGLFFYTKLTGPLPFYIYSVQTSKNDFFTATGEGKATAVPDIATVSVGITQKSATVSDAQSKINQVSNKIIYAVKKLGIDEKDIETTSYNVNPDYDYSANQRITGYSATQNIEIKVKDTKKINQVIDTATLQGANLIGNVNFTFSDDLKAKLEDKARKQAVQEAKKKANSLAKASGIKLGKLINVSESNYLPVRVNFASGIGGIEEAKDTATNVTPGEGAVSITVTLSYQTY